MRITNEVVFILAEELNRDLTGCRIDKIRQPAKDLLIFDIRSQDNNRRLLLSAVPGSSRVHFTDYNYESPEQAPMFCMLLRKHISGAVITSVYQVNKDRVIALELFNIDEIGRKQDYILYIEMMPSSSNIILVDNQGLIIDCVRRRDYDSQMYRRIFPGMIYRFPQMPAGYKTINENIVFEGSISNELDSYYSAKERADLFSRTGKELRTSINNAIKRTKKKIEARQNELFATENREEYRHNADLIVSNIYRIHKGDTVLHCEDFYSDNKPVEIILDPLLSPQSNAAKLYKEYNKKKTASEYLTGLIYEARQQLDYLLSVQSELDIALSSSDLTEIINELISTGYIKSKKNQKQKTQKSNPLMYKSEEGYEILVGKNNIQNEELTFKTAKGNDLWFHAKDYHGSHVVLICGNEKPDERTIYQAACLAATHSEAKGNCSVDYTKIKNVKKQKHGYPGQVIYSDYKSIFVKNP